MKKVRICNATRPQTLPVVAEYCASFFTQLRGLMFRRSLPDQHGLLLVGSSDSRVNSSIHMLFMFFDITAVWINSQNQVVDVRLAKKWRPAYISRQPARYVLEIPASAIEHFQIGDQVRFEEVH